MPPKNPNVISMDEENVFNYMKLTYMECWYDYLKREETIESHFIPLTEEDVGFCLKLGELGEIYGERFKISPSRMKDIQASLLARIDTVLSKMNGRAFFRLTSRSAKDSWYGIGQRDLPYYKNKGLVLKPVDVFKWMGDSERIHEDLYDSWKNGHVPQIVLREWVEIKKHEEFRCFVIEKKIVGISQYYYQEYFPYLSQSLSRYQAAILNFFETIKDKIVLRNYVLDIIFLNDSPKLLEINPLCELTDPCLYNWKQDSFETLEFRYVKTPSKKDDSESNLMRLLLE